MSTWFSCCCMGSKTLGDADFDPPPQRQVSWELTSSPAADAQHSPVSTPLEPIELEIEALQETPLKTVLHEAAAVDVPEMEPAPVRVLSLEERLDLLEQEVQRLKQESALDAYGVKLYMLGTLCYEAIQEKEDEKLTDKGLDAVYRALKHRDVYTAVLSAKLGVLAGNLELRKQPVPYDSVSRHWQAAAMQYVCADKLQKAGTTYLRLSELQKCRGRIKEAELWRERSKQYTDARSCPISFSVIPSSLRRRPSSGQQ